MRGILLLFSKVNTLYAREKLWEMTEQSGGFLLACFMTDTEINRPVCS